MKVLKSVFIFIFTLVLTISSIALIMINLLNSTILNKNYVLAKLDETDYYNQIYDYVEDNFEKYIYQSGLDEDVLKNIITVEQIKEDTNIILNNIYDNKQEEINTDLIKNNLTENINNFLDENNLTADEKDIESFIKTITKEYSNSISHYKYEEKIYQKYDKAVEKISKLKMICIALIIVSAILLLVLNLKRFDKFATFVGIANLSAGVFLIFEKIYINSKIDVKNILVLNDAISLALRNIASDLLQNIEKNGIAFTVIGILVIIIFSIISALKKSENNKSN